jgi:UDP-N-acetylglucosamine--N-acetylmuramyl-(pentapeptide) pyrophosphoryl-undecaprenol N-acetylglucosamine transferase
MRRNGRTSLSRLAVAEVLRERGHEVLIFISEKEIDTLAVSNRPEFRFEKLPTIGLPSPFLAGDPALHAALQRKSDALPPIYRTFNPHVVLGMGGFTSTAPIPRGTAAQDPDVHSRIERHPGKANRLTARMTRAVLLASLIARSSSRRCRRKSPARRSEPT